MKILFQRLTLVIAFLLQVGCSCGIYGGETFIGSDTSREVSPKLLAEFAQDAKFRKTSESEFRKGSVYMTYDQRFHGVRIVGSYCSMPNELLFSSPAQMASEVLQAQNEAKAWFKSRRFELRVADTSDESKMQNKAEMETPRKPSD